MRFIKLKNEGKFATVDDEDFDRLSAFNWTVRKDGYVASGYGLMHRMVMNTPKGKDTDHRFGNRLDNRKSQLRTASRAQNISNMQVTARKTAKSKSRFKGVSWCKERSLWEAYIGKNYTKISLGRFKIEEDAARAYNKAAIRLFGEFACLNPI